MTSEELKALAWQSDMDYIAWEKARDETARLLKIAQKSRTEFIEALAKDIRNPSDSPKVGK